MEALFWRCLVVEGSGRLQFKERCIDSSHEDKGPQSIIKHQGHIDLGCIVRIEYLKHTKRGSNASVLPNRWSEAYDAKLELDR